jgi:ubiquinone biosynthesis protein
MTPRQKARFTRQEMKRYGHVLGVLARYGFEDILFRVGARYDVPWRDKLFTKKIRDIRNLSTAQRVRLALEELGPTYVKFGQALSSRPELLPSDFIRELSKLQDEVPPFPFQVVQGIIEAQFGHPLADLYDDFDQKPSAAASLAQVHHARLKTGEEVAVKVQRPGIHESVDADIRILRKLAALAERHIPEISVYQPAGIVEEFGRTIHQELDFVREGRSADSFRRFFEHDEAVHIPRVYWHLTGARVLTLEYIHGIKVSDNAQLDARGLDRKTIANNGAHLLLKEIFDFHKFHADPHPGNLFVLENNVIAPVDFGLIGVLDQATVDHLGALLTAIVDKDMESMTGIVLQMCQAGEQVDTGPIQLDLADLLERYYAVPLQELNMKEIIGDVTGILRRNTLRFPQKLAMVTKALITLEGVGCGLHPDFNVFEVIEPYTHKLVMQRADPAKKVRALKRTIDDTVTLLNTLPSDIREILAKVKHNDIAIQFEHRGLERLSSILDRSSNRLSFAVVIAALIIASSGLFQSGVGPGVFGYPLPGLAGLLMASVLGLWLLVGIVRSGRL